MDSAQEQTVQDQMALWLLDGVPAFELADAIMAALTDLSHKYATKAGVFGPTPEDYEETTIEAADTRVVTGEIEECTDNGMHFDLEGKMLSFDFRIYHVVRHATEDEVRSFLLKKLTKVLGGEHDDHYSL